MSPLKIKVTGVDLVTDNISKTSNAFLTARNISNNFAYIPFPSRMESKHTSELI